MAKTSGILKSSLAIALLFISSVCLSQTKTDSIKQNFLTAKAEIEQMLLGVIPLDYERAVFVTENAFYGNKGSFDDFIESINFHIDNINIISKNYYLVNNIKTKPNILISKDSANKNIQRAIDNFVIYKYITDTTYFVIDNKKYFHPNFQYAFSDPFATTNWQSSQVSSLLNEDKNYGNCNALTSFFKILSLRLNSNAILCTAPNHIFIRHADENGIFYNVELASKSFPGTGSIETISYTSDQAARSGIAMRELNLKQSVALLLINLAKGYEHKLNNKSDNFILDCAELCLKYDNLNLNAMLLTAEFLNNKVMAQSKTINQLQTNAHFIAYQKQITSLYNLGYHEMPLEMKNKLIAAIMQDTSYISAMPNNTYNPFPNGYKKYTRSYSLSNGMFEEVNTIKPKEQYFNIVFNTKTKKITAFTTADTTYNKYNFDPVVFALSVDPLAVKNTSWSPYSAFKNNPVFNIDGDGRDAIGYIGSDGKLYIQATYYTVEGGASTFSSVERTQVESKLNNFWGQAAGIKVTLADGKEVEIGGVEFHVKSGGDNTQAVAKVNSEPGANLLVKSTLTKIQKIAGNNSAQAITTDHISRAAGEDPRTKNTTLVAEEFFNPFNDVAKQTNGENSFLDEGGHVLGTDHQKSQEGETSTQFNERQKTFGSVERGKLGGSGNLKAPDQKDLQHVVKSAEFKLVDKPKDGK